MYAVDPKFGLRSWIHASFSFFLNSQSEFQLKLLVSIWISCFDPWCIFLRWSLLVSIVETIRGRLFAPIYNINGLFVFSLLKFTFVCRFTRVVSKTDAEKGVKMRPFLAKEEIGLVGIWSLWLWKRWNWLKLRTHCVQLLHQSPILVGSWQMEIVIIQPIPICCPCGVMGFVAIWTCFC